MKSKLDLIEARLQAFIENTVLLFPWGNRQNILVSRLVETLQDSLSEESDGSFSAPSVYTIFLSPDNLGFWETRQDIFDSLAGILQEAAIENNVHFNRPPAIRLAPDPNLLPNEIRIDSASPRDKLGETAVLSLKAEQKAENADPRPGNAFLIINGEVYPLRQVVVNIGRRLDNQLVVDDPRVSRSHAQLRASRGHFVLFDLNSTGGTYVNGTRITQQILKPGDVISLAGVPIIYGEDAPSSSGLTDKNDPTNSFPKSEEED